MYHSNCLLQLTLQGASNCRLLSHLECYCKMSHHVTIDEHTDTHVFKLVKDWRVTGLVKKWRRCLSSLGCEAWRQQTGTVNLYDMPLGQKQREHSKSNLSFYCITPVCSVCRSVCVCVCVCVCVMPQSNECWYGDACSACLGACPVSFVGSDLSACRL